MKNKEDALFAQKILNQVTNEFGLYICNFSKRVYITSPFFFPDGDGYCIAIKKENNKWYLSDFGHTYMHLTLPPLTDEDLFKEPAKTIIQRALSVNDIIDRDGELLVELKENDYSRSLFDFIGAISQMSSILYIQN